MAVRDVTAEEERRQARASAGLSLIFSVAAWVMWFVGVLMTTSVVLPAAEIRPGVAVVGAWPSLAALTLITCAIVQFALSRAQAFIIAILRGARIGFGIIVVALVLFGIDTGLNYLALLLPAQIPPEARTSLVDYVVQLFARGAELSWFATGVAVGVGWVVAVMPELLWTLAGYFRR